MNRDDDLFPGFSHAMFDTGEVSLFVRIGGHGPPLLLLHGYPQTHAAWHRVALGLAEHFTVIAPDLRGYGQSSCPPSDAAHRAYAKRTSAGDQVRLMRHFGFDSFAVMGHDRGGRVAYRLALDQPGCVHRLVLLDIMSTWDQWQRAQLSARHKLIHWSFLAQPAPIPETLIGANPVKWIEGRLRRGLRSNELARIDPRALAAYIASHCDPEHIHATCEDYRAGATCDLADDEADRAAGRRIQCPTFVIWGTHGSLSDVPDPLVLWWPWCERVVGCAVESGHYIAEDNAAALLAAVTPFLAAAQA